MECIVYLKQSEWYFGYVSMYALPIDEYQLRSNFDIFTRFFSIYIEVL